MRIVQNEKILNIISLLVENTHGTASSRHDKRHPAYYLLRGRVRFRKRESTRERAKQRQQIHTSTSRLLE